MGLLDDMQINQQRRPRDCRVKQVANTLDPKDAEIFIAAVEGTGWRIHNLEPELKRRGILISQGSIKKHRDGDCSCSKI